MLILQATASCYYCTLFSLRDWLYLTPSAHTSPGLLLILMNTQSATGTPATFAADAAAADNDDYYDDDGDVSAASAATGAVSAADRYVFKIIGKKNSSRPE